MSLETGDFKNRATRKLRLRPLKPTELPAHPSLTSLQSGRSEAVSLRDFVREVLTEAVDFSDGVIPSNFQKKGSPKKSPPAAAKVQLLSCDLLAGETWFARHSVHENAPLEGTASWDEFEEGLFDNHSVNEASYTPSIYDTHKVMDWNAQIEEIEGDFGVEYEEVVMEIFEMCHELPGPLDNRCFGELVVRGFTRAGAFVVAQIPIDLKKVPNAIYTNGENKTRGGGGKKSEKVVMGKYVSVERVTEQADGNVMWEMATASDAGGWIPLTFQKMGVPGALMKDVGGFIKQAGEQRKKNPPGHGKPEVTAEPEQSNGFTQDAANGMDKPPNGTAD